MAQKNMATPAKPASPAPAAPTTEKAADPKKPTKMSRANVIAMIAAGVFPADTLEKMEKQGLVTSGDGGGEDIFVQLKEGGIDEKLIEKFKGVLAEVNAALWKDAKTYIGKNPKHKFTFRDDAKKEYSYEAPAEIELAAWVKHFDPKQKENREAAVKAASATPAKS